MSFRFLSHLVIPFSTPSATDAISSRDGARPTWKLTTPEASRVKTPSGQSCAQCHHGPRLTDDAFHVVGFPTGRRDGAPDRGYIDGFALLAKSELSQSGPYSDARIAPRLRAPSPSMLGAFRTPSLRGLPQTAPYGHGGTFPTIEDVVAFYARGARDGVGAAGRLEPYFPQFDADSTVKLTAFLRVLTQ